MLLLGGSLGARHEDECESRRSNDTAKCSDRAKCSREKDGASVEIGPTQATEKGESDSKQLKSQTMEKGAATGAAHKRPADAADNADAKPKSMIKAGESGGRGRHVHQLHSVVVKFFLALSTSGH